MLIGGLDGKDELYIIIGYESNIFDTSLFEKAIHDVENQIRTVSGSGQNQQISHHTYQDGNAVVLNFGVTNSGIGSLKGNSMVDIGRFVSEIIKFCHT